MTTHRKKLIEVALPLDAINAASAREKSIRHGHPSTLHLWWARRPLAAARAVIFAQMVDDPSTYVDVLLADSKLRRKAESVLRARQKVWEEAVATAEKAASAHISAPAPGPEPTIEEVAAEIERERLFAIIRELVVWENTTNEEVLERARAEIWQSWRRTCAENADHPRAKDLFDRHKLPAFHDPFAGGGALPLEAQRLGLESNASDLNPVAVLINKAMIEIPPKFGGRPPVNPESRKDPSLLSEKWRGAQGLAADVRYYGKWMRDEAEERIRHLYPKVEITHEMARERPDLKPHLGKKLTVIAWLWARTVASPNPAFANVAVPLVSTFMLSTKTGKEAYVQPVVEDGGYRFTVRVGQPKDTDAAKSGTKATGRGANFLCVMSSTPIAAEYIRAEGKALRIGTRLMAIVAEGDHGRVYLAPTPEHEAAARKAKPEWKPDVDFLQEALGFRVGNYGMTKWSDLFADRQLVALTTFADLVSEARDCIHRDALAAGLTDDKSPLRDGGHGALAYAEAVSVYLAFALDKVADRGSSLGRWDPTPTQSGIINTFSRQAISMTWDFAESNPLGDASGNFVGAVDLVAKTIDSFPGNTPGFVEQIGATVQSTSLNRVVSTDPPYYDNIGYADLSDFFYVWLRRSLKGVFPETFATVAVPKAEELVATPHRHGGREHAEAFFLKGMTQAMHRLVEQSHPGFPVTIYYAFKQSESDDESGTSSTGWETFLDAVIRAGFAITGTWPTRTELANRMRSMESNALATSIVLVCRQRLAAATVATRRDFVTALKTELPQALAHLQRGNIAPVDLAQAAIGPGMAVFTRFKGVVDAEGRALSVRQALALINVTLDEVLAEQEGDFDVDSRWALAWFDQYGFDDGPYGVAETLSKAKNTSVDGMVEAGILISRAGKVRLLAPDELPPVWDPEQDRRIDVWEMLHHLIRVFEHAGEATAAQLLAKYGSKADVVRELAYRLYTACERRKRAKQAGSYNALVQSWPEIARLAKEGPALVAPRQDAGLFDQE
jgi:putative DNA methylase